MTGETTRDAVYVLDGDSFVPTPSAGSPWSAGLQHGGPPSGLLTRAIEAFARESDLQISRLSIDLLRPIPMTPLRVRTNRVRSGKRMQVVDATLHGGGMDVARASGLLLRQSDAPESQEPPRVLPGPDGLRTESFIPKERLGDVPYGFHVRLETRATHDPASGQYGLWLRLPIPLVAGETATMRQVASALADLTGSVGLFAERAAGGIPRAFINPDTTVYFTREPVGEWIGFEAGARHDSSGIGVAATIMHDRLGAFGQTAQARLAQPQLPSSKT